MKVHRILTIPISWIWALVLTLRHKLYDWGLLAVYKPTIPTIVVGNLSFGGTGKTPHVIWLCEHFKDKNVAVLSRGHGRKSSGFMAVSQDSSAQMVGDEPLFMAKRLPKVRFFVCEKRKNGIEKILADFPETDLIILDDAFQHRSVQGGMRILLTTHGSPYHKDYLVPAGRLRDLKSRAANAKVLIVSKCPENQNITEWSSTLNQGPNQALFFSGMKYGKPYELATGKAVDVPSEAAIVAISGIANPTPFNEYVQKHHSQVSTAAYADHHQFSKKDISHALGKMSNFASGEKWFVTTEKDGVRLIPFKNQLEEAGVRVAVLPISVELLSRKNELRKLLDEYVG